MGTQPTCDRCGDDIDYAVDFYCQECAERLALLRDDIEYLRGKIII